MQQLRNLTDAVHTKKVIKGLIELGIAYRMSGNKPVVLVSAVERALGGDTPFTDAAPSIDMAARLARARKDGKTPHQRPRPA